VGSTQNSIQSVDRRHSKVKADTTIFAYYGPEMSSTIRTFTITFSLAL